MRALVLGMSAFVVMAAANMLTAGSAAAQSGYDRPGADITNAAVPSGDPAACAARCEREKNCRSWSFSYPSASGEPAMCWLKHEVRRGVPSPCCVSGVRGAALIDAKNGARALVINAMGRIFMDPLDDPFAAIERELSACPLKSGADAIVIDMHCEATSEKQAMGFFADGRASLVVGTHTHTPSADDRILPGGTAFMTDVGMTGDYNSIVGMATIEPMRRFTTGIGVGRFEPASGEATMCGIFVVTDDRTGLAVSEAPVRLGGCLKPTVPGD